MKEINVLSLFDGISGARVAFHQIKGLKVRKYFASEIDKYAIKVSRTKHGDITHVGDIREIFYKQNDGLYWSPYTLHGETTYAHASDKIDFVIGGSPCQDLSRANENRKGLKGKKSGLFYEFKRVLKETQPAYFLLENVASMADSERDTITKELLEVYPDTKLYNINSIDISYTNRDRYYWTNIPITIPIPKEKQGNHYILITEGEWIPVPSEYIFGDEVRIPDGTKAGYSVAQHLDIIDMSRPRSPTRRGRIHRGYFPTLLASMGKGLIPYILRRIDGRWVWRKLIEEEVELAMGFPYGYTNTVTKCRRFHALGNSFHVGTIHYFLKNLEECLTKTNE